MYSSGPAEQEERERRAQTQSCRAENAERRTQQRERATTTGAQIGEWASRKRGVVGIYLGYYKYGGGGAKHGASSPKEFNKLVLWTSRPMPALPQERVPGGEGGPHQWGTVPQAVLQVYGVYAAPDGEDLPPEPRGTAGQGDLLCNACAPALLTRAGWPGNGYSAGAQRTQTGTAFQRSNPLQQQDTCQQRCHAHTRSLTVADSAAV